MRRAYQALEFIVLITACAVGVFALRRGLGALFGRPAYGSAIWLPLAGVAWAILGSQMARVHHRWPHRPERGHRHRPWGGRTGTARQRG